MVININNGNMSAACGLNNSSLNMCMADVTIVYSNVMSCNGCSGKPMTSYSSCVVANKRVMA